MQGWADYSYQLFYPVETSAGREPQTELLRESRLVWDSNFQTDGHHFDASELADFLWEVHGYLADSTLLLSTENGYFCSNAPGLEIPSEPLGELLNLDSREKLEAALVQWGSERSYGEVV